MLRSLFNALLDFAGDCLRREYATGGGIGSSSGDLETDTALGLGGAATEHPCCIAPAADFARDDLKTFFHVRKDAA